MVTERRADIGVPVVEYQSTGRRPLLPAAPLVRLPVPTHCGPVGAVVGAVAGAATGGFTEEALAPEARTYVMENPGETVYLDGEVVVGAQVPDTVEVREDPGLRVPVRLREPAARMIVEPDTRRIVYIVR